MSNSFKKKINEDEKKLLLKYLKSFVKQNTSSTIDVFIKTKNYAITIYKNNTLLIQGSNYQNILKMLNIDNFPINNEENQKITYMDIIGSDETGNGDFFGGISVCACYVRENRIQKLIDIGVKDSKLLTDKQMLAMEKELLKYVSYKCIYVDPNTYNQLYEKYKNVNTIKTLFHAHVIEELIKDVGTKEIVIDEFCNNNSFKKHLQTLNKNFDFRYHLQTKAESKYIQVAAASIIARILLVKEHEKLSKKIGIDLPYGSVDSIVLNTFKKIKNRKDLNDICKTHFKTFSK